MQRLFHTARSASTLLWVGALVFPAAAQQLRYDVGLRYRALEQAAESAAPGSEARKKLSPIVEGAVTKFFSLDLAAVAASLDRARLGLAETTSDTQRLAASLSIRPAARLIDQDRVTLPIEVRPVYRLEELEIPDDATLSIQWRWRRVGSTEWMESGTPSLRWSPSDLPVQLELPLAKAGEGDFQLAAIVRNRGAEIAQHQILISRARDLKTRLDRVRTASRARRERKTTESETLRYLAGLLVRATRRAPLETDVPGVELLAEAESLVDWLEADPAPELHYAIPRSGALRLRVATADGVVTCRLFAPKTAARGTPLVVALHGAGGSENLFFEGYGNGLAVRLAEERGWHLVAPKDNGMSPRKIRALVQALAERFPIDEDRVLLVGHSMGARRAVVAASTLPKNFAAVSAIGGGGPVRFDAAGELRKTPFFIGVGSRDFLLRGARALRDAVRRGEGELTYREYSDVEHMLIVQDALPDTFRFFDSVLAQ